MRKANIAILEKITFEMALKFILHFLGTNNILLIVFVFFNKIIFVLKYQKYY